MTQFSSTTKGYFSFHKKAFQHHLKKKKFLQKNSSKIFNKTILLRITHRQTSRHMYIERLFSDDFGEITIVSFLQKISASLLLTC